MINQSSNSACLKYEAVLEDFLDGQLSASDSKDLAGHLAVCAGCRDALALAQDSVRLVRVLEPVIRSRTSVCTSGNGANPR